MFKIQKFWHDSLSELKLKIYFVFSILLYKTWLPIFLLSLRYLMFFVYCFFFIREYFYRIVEVFLCQNILQFSTKNVSLKAGPNTEKYGPRSVYGFLRTGCRPMRMQDSLKPYNKIIYNTVFGNINSINTHWMIKKSIYFSTENSRPWFYDVFPEFVIFIRHI